MYRGNFFNATTLSAGASLGESHTMYGKDNFTMLLAGIGNKLGYNFEFKDGKYIIQPSMLMSYTFVNTFDYTNSAGVHIDSDPLHAIQLTPGVKFIMNTKNGWQPYVGINMVWNILNKNKVTANDVRLPEMSIKPYVQYGLGVQKRIKDKFLAFGQAMVSNGGRNGVSLLLG
ncbi:MAG: autotransporter outer membrane beta-barrel domain-containing protein [Candidatus Gastranaerophilaceae bacterium]